MPKMLMPGMFKSFMPTDGQGDGVGGSSQNGDPSTITSVTGEQIVNPDTDYVATIQKLLKTRVDRSLYEKLEARNKQLLETIVNGQGIEKKPDEPNEDISEIRKRLFSSEPQTNLQFWKDTLALRNALIQKGEPDPLLPIGNKITPTNEDIECADRVATVVKECIDYADGDSQAFTNELLRKMIDTCPSSKKPR